MHVIYVDQACEFPDSEHVTSISSALQEVALLDAAITDRFHKQVERPPVSILIALGTYQAAPDGQLWNTMCAYAFGIFADEITLSNPTIKNTCGRGEVAGQGLALFAGGDKCHIKN